MTSVQTPGSLILTKSSLLLCWVKVNGKNSPTADSVESGIGRGGGPVGGEGQGKLGSANHCFGGAKCEGCSETNTTTCRRYTCD